MAAGLPEFEGERMRLDPRDPAFFRDPWPAYAHMHARAASHVWSEYGQRCFHAHADVSALLRDRRFGRPPDRSAKRTPRAGLARFDAVDALSLLELEPPEHTRLRRRVNRAFVSRSIDRLAPFIERRAHELIDGFDARGTDLLASYATPLPVDTIAVHLGVPTRDRGDLLRWSHAMVAMYQFGADDAAAVSAERSTREFETYLRQHIRAKRRTPTEDLLSALANGGGDEMTDDEIVATAILLLNAGHEATVHQIANTVRALLLHAQPEGWWTDPQAVERTVEEGMRFDAPLHLFTRTAYEDVEWRAADGRAVPIGAGETVGLLLGAANRDPRRFERPGVFDPTRAMPDHVAFGGGIHFCVGAPLARVELRIALRVLFERLPTLRMAGEPAYADTFHFHGLERLDVGW